MSFYSDASLVMIPSGYKTSKVYCAKPTDGSGDLVFSRSNDTATRVNSAGLIEKVRTNYILQSNTFNTTWLATDLTVTSGATDPNGGTTAWTAAATAASGIIQQAVTLTGLRTFSIYAKQGTLRYLYMGAYGGTISYATFDLQDGVVAAGTNARIESVGGGWYRCTCHSADGTTGGVQILPTDTISSGTIGTGNILIWRAQYETGDIATDYIATTTAAVSVGPVANVPRLDYLNSSCPRLLLEPQRTNLVPFSDGLQVVQAFGATFTKNQITSPDGYVNASLLTPSGAAGITLMTGSFSGNYTVSVYLKGTVAGQKVRVFGDFQSTIANFTLTTSWARYTTTFNSTNATGQSIYLLAGSYFSPSENNPFYVYGAQIEAGAYATSYIPTLGSASTRGRDDCAKTGISSLIGQTAGTVFVEFEFSGSKDTFWPVMTVMGASSAELIEIYGSGGSNVVGVYMLDNGVTQFAQSRTLTVGRHKLAIAYELNNTVAYLDGTVMGGVDTSCTIPTMTQIGVGEFAYSSAYTFGDRIDQAILFPVRLSNSDLAALTA